MPIVLDSQDFNDRSIEDLLDDDPFSYSKRFALEIHTFYDKMYAEPAIGIDSSLIDHESTETRLYDLPKLCFLTGYAGCGKSTFIHKILYDLSGKSKSEIGNILSYDDRQYLYDFSYSSNSSDSSSASILCNNVARKLADILHNETRNQLAIFEEIISNENASILDEKYTIKSLYYDIKHNAPTWESIVKALNGLSSYLLIVIDYFIRVAYYSVSKDERYKYICYDNIDAIENDQDINELICSCVKFLQNTCRYYVAEYSKESIAFPCRMIISCRKVTKAKLSSLSEQARDPSERWKSRIITVDATKFYSYSMIIEKRVSYYNELYNLMDDPLKESNTQKYITLNSFKNLFCAELIKTRYQKIYDYNYRIAVRMLFRCFNENREVMHECERLLSIDAILNSHSLAVYTYAGASSIILRLLFNMLKDSGTFQQLLSIPKTFNPPDIKWVIMSRMILVNIYRNEESEIRLDGLVSSFRLLFKSTDICDLIIRMSNRDFGNDYLWRRLVFCSNGVQLSKEYIGLCSESPILAITDAGKSYVDTISSHFEFFSCLCCSNTIPLFNGASVRKKDEIYAFENSIKNVYMLVGQCCNILGNLYDTCTNSINTEARDSLLTLFYWRTRIERNPQLYEECIIFSHIAYLDAFRRYCISIEKEESQTIQKIIAKWMLKYLALYEFYVLKRDNSRKKRYELLKSKAYSMLEGCEISNEGIIPLSGTHIND